MPCAAQPLLGRRDQRRRGLAVERFEHAPLADARPAYAPGTRSSTWALIRPTTSPVALGQPQLRAAMPEPGVLLGIDQAVDFVLERRHPGRVVLVDLPREVDECLAVGLGGDRADGDGVAHGHGERLARRAAMRQPVAASAHCIAMIVPLSRGNPTPSGQALMTILQSLAEAPAAAPAQSASRRSARGRDDKAMLRAAADLTRDLNVARRAIYWADLLGSAVLGYGALGGAMLVAARRCWRSSPALVGDPRPVSAPAASFTSSPISSRARCRGFRLAWNADRRRAAAGARPSCTRASTTSTTPRSYYGTVDDPEYLPLALMKPWTLPVFLVAAALAPIALLFRFAVLTPLSLLSPRLREAGGRALFGAADQSRVPPQARRGRVRPPLALAGSRRQPLGDRADRDGRDRHRPAARLPHLPRRRRRA